jgi:hypothetical protein
LEAVSRCREMFGDRLHLGGSGVDLNKRLPQEIEALQPDYDLYQIDYGLGFISRGCPFNCPFCLVPIKEGKLKQVSIPDDLLNPRSNKLVLLDDNFLALTNSIGLMREFITANIQVNFNQTLDIRVLNEENSVWLEQVDSRNFNFSRRRYYFSLNSTALIPLLDSKRHLLTRLGARHLIFVCMYGFDTTLSQDIERFSYLMKLGASPFVQEFQPVLGRSLPRQRDYFDTDPAPLTRLHYPRNGRNFEVFLKWVSRRYAEQFGKIHPQLVDRIFLYNYKEKKRRYIETAAGTRA